MKHIAVAAAFACAGLAAAPALAAPLKLESYGVRLGAQLVSSLVEVEYFTDEFFQASVFGSAQLTLIDSLAPREAGSYTFFHENAVSGAWLFGKSFAFGSDAGSTAWLFAVEPESSSYGAALRTVYAVLQHPLSFADDFHAEGVTLDVYRVINEVPTPPVAALLGIGLVGLGVLSRRRRA